MIQSLHAMNKIAELNDQFRKGDTSLGITHMTSGVRAISHHQPEQFASLLQLIKDFNGFSESNDPYKEHDLIVVKLDGESYYYKIDYYDRKAFSNGQEIHSEDPSDPEKTWRVGTLMRADEY